MIFRLFVVFSLVSAAPSLGAVIHVSASATGTADGSSWTHAYTTISNALAAASPGDEVWVASGTYVESLVLPDGVEVYGGFDSSENAHAQMAPETHATIISGGGGQRAISSVNTSTATVLRGFTITDGHVTGLDQAGGGIYLKNSSATFAQCRFIGNAAEFAGGAVANYGGGSPTFVNCEFIDNGSAAEIEAVGGGAIFNHDGAPRFVNCLFTGNRAGDGGAVVSLTGAISFVNCTFFDNEATKRRGGAIFDNRGEAIVRNSILWANISTELSSRALYNHARASSRTDVAYSDVEGGWEGTSNIDQDPLFVDVAAGDFRLQGHSPCRDRGRSRSLPAELVDLDWDGRLSANVPTDLDRGQRIEGAAVDMGAFERRP